MEAGTCRLCLDKDHGLLYIFEVIGVQSNVVADIISEVLQFDVFRADNYPPFICYQCYGKVTEFKKFKDQCKASRLAYDNELIQREQALEKHSPIPSNHRPIQLKQELGIFSTNTFPEVNVDNPREQPLVQNILPCRSEADTVMVTPHEVTEKVKSLQTVAEIQPVQQRQVSKTSHLKEEYLEETNIGYSEITVSPVKLEVVEVHIHEKDQGKIGTKQAPEKIGDSRDISNAAGCQLALNPSGSEIKVELITLDEDDDYVGVSDHFGEGREAVGLVSLSPSISKLKKEAIIQNNVNDLSEVRKRMQNESLSWQRETKEAEETSLEVCRTSLRSRTIRDYRLQGSSSEDFMSEESCTEEYQCEDSSSGESSSKEIRTKKPQLAGPEDRRHEESQQSDPGLRESTLGELGSDKSRKLIEKKTQDKGNGRGRRGKKMYVCLEYEKNFNHSSNLQLHLRSIHSDEQPFECNLCNKRFKLKHHLTQHKVMHKRDRSFKCGICDSSFLFEQQLLRHHIVHSRHKTYQCGICEADFDKKDELVKHYPLHDGVRVWQCGECKKWFGDWKDLVEHHKVHGQNKEFMCDICGKGCVVKAELRKHLCLHTRPYECSICSKRFTTGYTLRLHIQIHNRERPYQCMFCTKSFYQKNALNNHIKIHTGEMAFSCHVCGRSFSLKSSLIGHLTTHSNEKTFDCDHPSRS